MNSELRSVAKRLPQVVDAPCPQGLEGQYREMPASQGQPVQPNIVVSSR